MSYHYVICTPAQWPDIRAIGNFGQPRESLDKSKMLTNLNGNLPLSPDQIAAVERAGAEVYGSNIVDSAWLVEQGFQTPEEW